MTAQLSQQENENKVGRAIPRASPWSTWQLSKRARSARSTLQSFYFLRRPIFCQLLLTMRIEEGNVFRH